MRLKTMLLASCVGATGLAAIGPAEAGGLYGSFFGGLNWTQDFRGATASSRSAFSTSFFNFNAATDTGFVVGVAIGYDLSEAMMKGLRVELEGTYRHNNGNGPISAGSTTFSSGGTSTVALGTDVVTWALMANVWYDFDIGSKLKPYVGGGIGWARNKLVPELTVISTVENEDLAWQLGAGFNYQISPSAAIGLGYRYMDSGEQGSFTSFFGNTVNVGDVSHQDVMLNFNFSLN
jgi:opacity protein-like surface antigen